MELTYEIGVANPASASDNDVVVVATLPEGMTFVPLGTSGPALYKPEGQTVRFEPVAEIHAGETLTYRLRVRANKAGQMRVGAEVTSRRQAEPLAKQETTEVLE